MTLSPICGFDGCDRPRETRGLCSSHYRQQWRGEELRPIRHRSPQGTTGLGRVNPVMGHALALVDDSGLTAVYVCECDERGIAVGEDRLSVTRQMHTRHAIDAARRSWDGRGRLRGAA